MGKGISRRGWLAGLLAALAGLVAPWRARAAGPASTGVGTWPGWVAPGPGGLLVTWRYDAAGRLVSTCCEALPGPSVMTYTYAGGGRLTSVTDPPGAVTTFTYDASDPPDPRA